MIANKKGEKIPQLCPFDIRRTNVPIQNDKKTAPEISNGSLLAASDFPPFKNKKIIIAVKKPIGILIKNIALQEK